MQLEDETSLITGATDGIGKQTHDRELQRRLWDVSARLVGLED